MMNKNTILKIISENRDKINQFYVIKIGLFGSYASGNADENSDIDILVDFEKGHKDFFNYMRLKYFLEELLSSEVDLVMINALKDEIRNDILKETKYA